MPFIRFKLGDVATWADSECTCGRSWPLLKKIEGRSMQIVTLPSGRRVPFGVIIWPLIKTVEGIKRFQITFQQSNKNVIVRVVCSKNINEKQKGHIQQEIIRKVKLAFLNEDLNVEVEFVNTIRPQASGKTPDFIRESC